jgi:sirohydrochlorin ferrochelatase
MELAEPSVGTAFDACVSAGATTVVVAPYFLWPGNHWDRDIPALAAEAGRRHPGVRYLVAAPLGPHPLLGDIVEERIDHCLAHAAGRAPECDVCAGTGRCRLV